MSVDITIQETVNEVDITVNQNVITVNVTRTTGSGGVESVTGDLVDNTDPLNPIVEVPSLTQVLTVGDRLFETPGIRNFEIADRTKYLLCFGGEILTLNESIINFPVNSLIQFRVLDQSVSLQVVGTLCYYLDSVTPVTSLNLLAGDYCELKKIDLTNWILTVTNSGGVTQDLAMVLAVDNKTNDIPIVSNNVKAVVDVNDDYVYISYEGNYLTLEPTNGLQLSSNTNVLTIAPDMGAIIDGTINYTCSSFLLNNEEVATQPWVTSQGYGTGTVTSVMGDLVDNTDPSNPIVNTPSLDDCAVASGNQMTESVTISAGTDAVGLFPTGLNVSDIATGEGIDITKNGILVQTAGSAGGNASIKSDNITAGNTYSAQLPNKAGGSDEIIAMQSDLDFTRRLITKGTGSVTGTVSETILTTLTIPANTLDSSCFIWTTMDFFKTNAGTVTARLYVNNANTLTGATLLGFFTLGSNRNVSFNRKFLVTGTSLDLLTANTASSQVSNEFIENLYAASTVLTINPSADIFLIYTTQNDATVTVATNKMATVQKMKL